MQCSSVCSVPVSFIANEFQWWINKLDEVLSKLREGKTSISQVVKILNCKIFSVLLLPCLEKLAVSWHLLEVREFLMDSLNCKVVILYKLTSWLIFFFAIRKLRICFFSSSPVPISYWVQDFWIIFVTIINFKKQFLAAWITDLSIVAQLCISYSKFLQCLWFKSIEGIDS